MAAPMMVSVNPDAFSNNGCIGFLNSRLRFSAPAGQGKQRRIPFPSLLSLFASVESVFSFRKKKADGEAQAPVRAAAGAVGVILRAEAELNRLFADLEQLAHARVERHGPLMLVPIVSGLGVDAEGRERLGRVGNERLEEGGVDFRVATAGVGPEVVHQE